MKYKVTASRLVLSGVVHTVDSILTEKELKGHSVKALEQEGFIECIEKVKAKAPVLDDAAKKAEAEKKAKAEAEAKAKAEAADKTKAEAEAKAKAEAAKKSEAEKKSLAEKAGEVVEDLLDDGKLNNSNRPNAPATPKGPQK